MIWCFNENQFLNPELDMTPTMRITKSHKSRCFLIHVLATQSHN